MEKYFYTYVLKSLKDNKFYTGWTDNLEGRLSLHNSGKVNATKYLRPFKLVYFEACLSQTKALAREKTLKTGFGRKYLKTRI